MIVTVSDCEAIVSDEDAALVEQHRWYVARNAWTTYAMRTDEDGQTVYMHREIMGAGPGEQVDHINRDGLDNRRENLRVCTQSQNMAHARRKASATGFRGVHKHGRKWRAIVGRNERGRNLYAGSFDTPEEAALARDEAALNRWGEFASLNFAA